MHVNTQTPDDDSDGQNITQYNFQSSSDALLAKVNAAVTVAVAMSRIASDVDSAIGSTEFVPSAKKVIEDATETFGYATARLNKMLVDGALWDTNKFEKTVDEHLKNLTETNLNAAKARLALLTHHNRPAVKAGARVFFRRDDKMFIVCLNGGPDDPDVVMTEGKTVEVAFAEMDALLTGKSDEKQ
jgi:hypothetical protein